MTDVDQIDLTDVDLFVNNEHHAVLDRLRAERPVHWTVGADGTAFWSLTRYADVLDAYRNHATFRSARGAILGGSFGSDDDTAGGQMLVASDLPRHRLLKQQIHPALRASVAVRVREQTATLLDRAVGRLLAAGGGDFAADVATELPAAALMTVMGIGHDDAHTLIGLTRRMVNYRDTAEADPEMPPRLLLAIVQAEILGYFAELAAARRRRPGDDLVSVLLRAEINGRSLSEEEVLYNCLNVAVGGNETTSHSICAGVVAFAEWPDQWARLVADPGLLPSAIEEILRWSSVNAYVQRAVRQDVTLDGVLLRAGDSVCLWNVSANRDERAFPHADTFDIGRTPNRHLSYGAGIHRCIGAPLAQSELVPLWERLVSQRVTLRLAGPVGRMRSNFILGYTELPVTVG